MQQRTRSGVMQLKHRGYHATEDEEWSDAIERHLHGRY